MSLPDFVNQSNVSLTDRVSGFFGNETKHDNLITSVEDIYNEVKEIDENIKVLGDEIRKDAEQIHADAIIVNEYGEKVLIAATDTKKWRDEAVGAAEVAVTAKDAALGADGRAQASAANAKLSETAADSFAHDAKLFANSALISEEESKRYFNLSYSIYEDLVKGQVYRGTWNPHTQSYPDPKGTNSVWDVVLNPNEVSFSWNGKTWYWGDRLVYIHETTEYQQVESGLSGGVISVNGKKGAVTLNASDVNAVPVNGSRVDSLGNSGGYYSAGSYDFNDFDASFCGLVNLTDAKNAPPLSSCSNNFVHIEVQKTYTGDLVQRTVPFRNAKTIAFRTKQGTTWKPWVTEYTSLNQPTASDVGAVPTTRKVNGKVLTDDITLDASDVGAVSYDEIPEILPFVTPEQYGAKCDGVSDDAPAIQLALQKSIEVGIPLVMNRTYNMETEVVIEGNHTIAIEGNGTINHKRSAFLFSGIAENEIPLSAAITDFSQTEITITDASKFEEGSMGIIHSNVMCLSKDASSMQLGIATAGGAPDWFGEWFQVREKEDKTLKLIMPLVFRSYGLTPLTHSGERPISTVKKVLPITGSISGNIKFNRIDNTYTAVKVTYGKDFTINGRFDARKSAGVSVMFLYCFACEVRESTFILDPSTKAQFGTVNPGSPQYYAFNSVKLVSSQACGAESCSFENGTQNLDITYDKMSSVMCYMRNCLVTNAKHNVATSHAGSYANTFSGNTALGCWRGIAARCREDAVINNRIIGFRKYPKCIYTNSDSVGISLSEGFTVGAIVSGNYVSGFYKNIYVNNNSSRGTGFDYNRVTISNNRLSYAFNNIDIDNVMPEDKTIDSGIVIIGNQFDTFEGSSIVAAAYTRTLIIKDNVFLDKSSSGTYCVNLKENCVGLQFTGNNFHKDGRILLVQSITDSELGSDTIDSAKITSQGNIVRENYFSDTYIYGSGGGKNQVRASLGNNFQSNDTGYKYVNVSQAAEYILDTSTLTTVGFGGVSGQVVITDMTAGINGRELTLCNPSKANKVIIKNSTTVITKTGSDYELVGNVNSGIARFIYVNSAWRQV